MTSLPHHLTPPHPLLHTPHWNGITVSVSHYQHPGHPQLCSATDWRPAGVAGGAGGVAGGQCTAGSRRRRNRRSSRRPVYSRKQEGGWCAEAEASSEGEDMSCHAFLGFYQTSVKHTEILKFKE